MTISSGQAATPPAAPRSVSVYCASSRQCHPAYHEAAERLGRALAASGVTVVYGGGGGGSMGALANGALAHGGRVIGVLPRFMRELEWGHTALSELVLVDDMRQRKQLMLERGQGAVALPGGCGTLDELCEVLTLKRLGLYFHPIVLVNTRRFFDPLVALLESAVSEHFMDERHRAMWQVVAEPEAVPEALATAPPWTSDAQGFAVS